MVVRADRGSEYYGWSNEGNKFIGSLMCAKVCIRPDIAYVVNVLGRF